MNNTQGFWEIVSELEELVVKVKSSPTMDSGERDFFGKCFAKEEERPGAAELREHEWLNGEEMGEKDRKVVNGIIKKDRRERTDKNLTAHDTNEATMVIIRLRAARGIKEAPGKEEIGVLSRKLGVFEVTVEDGFREAEKR